MLVMICVLTDAKAERQSRRVNEECSMKQNDGHTFKSEREHKEPEQNKKHKSDRPNSVNRSRPKQKMFHKNV